MNFQLQHETSLSSLRPISPLKEVRSCSTLDSDTRAIQQRFQILVYSLQPSITRHSSHELDAAIAYKRPHPSENTQVVACFDVLLLTLMTSRPVRNALHTTRPQRNLSIAQGDVFCLQNLTPMLIEGTS